MMSSFPTTSSCPLSQGCSLILGRFTPALQITQILRVMCPKDVANFCSNLLFLFGGFDRAQMNITLLEEVVKVWDTELCSFLFSFVIHIHIIAYPCWCLHYDVRAVFSKCQIGEVSKVWLRKETKSEDMLLVTRPSTNCKLNMGYSTIFIQQLVNPTKTNSP